jgi:hypothetical protein
VFRRCALSQVKGKDVSLGHESIEFPDEQCIHDHDKRVKKQRQDKFVEIYFVYEITETIIY